MELETKIEGVATKKVAKRTKIDEKNSTISQAHVWKGEFFEGFNDFQIYVRTWDDVENARGVVLLLHGMVEHGGRYDNFAQFLNSKGYIVIAPDHRGHGKTAGAPENVTKYDGDIFADTVRDCIKLADVSIHKYKLPLFVIGHSYGSFLTQSFIQNYHQHRGVVLVGSSCMAGSGEVAMGKMVACLTRKFKGKDAPAKMIHKMSLGKYGKGFERGNWLTQDEKIFNEYRLDPYCGAVASVQFYHSFFSNLKKIYKTKMLNRIEKHTPILITSGEFDPVGGKNHKGVDKLAPLYQKYGLSNVEYKLWENGRHEILNEIFRNDVYNYIADFLDKINN